MIKLLAIDLDDTLLREDLTISDRNREALRRAEEKGVQIVLASGRAVPAMEHFAEDLGMFERPGFMISDNGSTVSSTCPREILVAHTLETDLLDELFDFFEERGLPVQIYQGKTILVTRKSDVTTRDMKLSGFTRKILPRLKTELTFPPLKLVIPGDPEVLVSTLKAVRTQFRNRVNTFISKPYLLEVLPAHADKGSALQFVAERLNIPREEVMAMGDSGNDLGMVSYAGWGVAMANATEEVKAAAKIVTQATHQHDGVAEIVEGYLLSGSLRS